MRNVTEKSITEVFAESFGDNTDPRAREILVSLTRHLHDFAREVRLTHDEWRKALELAEWAGRITTSERNEFVLLSDILGLSSLVDMINSAPQGTSSSVLGPFHISGAPALPVGGDLKGKFEGEVVLCEGFVRDVEGRPIEGAKIDIWQTAPNALYSSQDPEQDTYSFHGLQTTGADGRFAFTTVRPVFYPVPTDGPGGRILDAMDRHAWRPSHLHFIVEADGFRNLVTEIFPDDDPYLDEDTVFGVREDLIMQYVPQAAGSFPDGFALSGKVDGAYSRAEIGFVLTRV